MTGVLKWRCNCFRSYYVACYRIKSVHSKITVIIALALTCLWRFEELDSRYVFFQKSLKTLGATFRTSWSAFQANLSGDKKGKI